MKRLPMRKIRDVLRLSAEGLSTRQIAASLAIGRTTLRGYLDRATELGLSWPLPAEMSDTDLERCLFHRAHQNTQRIETQPDWSYIHRELRRKGVTLSLLWEEHRSDHPEGYGYSRFCELYTRWEGKLSPVMRQRHPAGERLFVDYAGHTIDVIDPQTGEVRAAQLFVATLGASSYTFAEATWTQSLPDWISSHVRAFGFLGGVTAQVVSDNLKAGVTKACFYDPVINRTYADLATHYDTAVVPARPHKPKDKAKVEGAVLLVERWILARLRNRQFFSLGDVNAAIRPLLDQLNDKVSRHLGASRKQLFEQLDKPRPEAATDGSICLCRMEEVPSRARLSRSDRQTLLLCAPSVAEERAVGPHYRPHGRSLPCWTACCFPCAHLWKRQAFYTARPHAGAPQVPRGLDTTTYYRTGRSCRAECRYLCRGCDARTQAPRTGLPELSGHHPAGRQVRCCPP